MTLNKKQRQIVFDKYGGRCAYCGCELEKGWHADHLEPCRRIVKTESVLQPEGYKKVERLIGYSNPDANHINNYMPACPSCNINKHSDTIERFRASIAQYVNSLNLYSVQYRMAKKFGLIQETGNPVVFHFEKIKEKEVNND